MAIKKTTEEAGGWGSGVELLFESVANGIRRVAEDIAESVERGTMDLFRKLLRSLGFFFFSVLAAVFLLVGIARVLDTVYQLPGVGEVVVGAFIFAGVLLFFMIDQQHNT